MRVSIKTALCISLLLPLIGASIAPAEASRWRARGQQGAAGAYNQVGQYGQRAGARAIRYGQGGAGVNASTWQGPNGGSFRRGGMNAYKSGVGGVHASGSQGAGPNGGNYQRTGVTAAGQQGAYHNSQFSGTSAAGSTLDRHSTGTAIAGQGANVDKGFNYAGANGSSASGYKTNNYDATTGSGSSTRGRDYNTASGESYGYDANTTYQKGEGFSTTIDTQNKQDYTIDYSKGSKPVVTPTGTTN